MSDITKCYGFECPVKEKCKRFTAPADDLQSYFLDQPYTITDNVFKCDMYWGDGAESAWQTLQEALGIKIPDSE